MNSLVQWPRERVELVEQSSTIRTGTKAKKGAR